MITSHRIAEQRRLRTFILVFFLGCFVFFLCFWFSFWTAAITWSHLWFFFRECICGECGGVQGREKNNKNKTSMVGTQADWKRPAIKSVFFFCAGLSLNTLEAPSWRRTELNSAPSQTDPFSRPSPVYQSPTLAGASSFPSKVWLC